MPLFLLGLGVLVAVVAYRHRHQPLSFAPSPEKPTPGYWTTIALTPSQMLVRRVDHATEAEALADLKTVATNPTIQPVGWDNTTYITLYDPTGAIVRSGNPASFA